MLIVFGVTGIYLLKGEKLNNQSKQAGVETRNLKLLTWVFFISFFVSMYFEFDRATIVQKEGYANFIYRNTFGYVLSNLLNLLSIVMFLLYRNKKVMLIIILVFVFFRISFIIFMVGNRGSSVITLIVFLYMLTSYSCLSSFFKNKYTIISLAVIVIVILPFISLSRGTSGGNIVDVLSKHNPLIYFLSEFGSTVNTVILSFDYVDRVGVMQGKQMMYSSLSMFPSSEAIFGSDYIQYVSISGMLNNFNDVSGLGGSLIGQLYLNFGNSAFVFLIFAGFAALSAWASNKLRSFSNSSVKMILYITVFSSLLITVRGEWYDFVTQMKMVIYFVLVVYMLTKLRSR
jgi:hypothetical protein